MADTGKVSLEKFLYCVHPGEARTGFTTALLETITPACLCGQVSLYWWVPSLSS